MQTPKILIIIVGWNGEKFLTKCIKSLLKQTYKKFDILYIDNNSKDKSINTVSKFRVKIIRNKENLGFATANNQGFRHAIKNNFDAAVLLNQDTEVDKKWLEELIKTAYSRENIGITSSKVLLLDNRINVAGICYNYLGYAWAKGLYEKDKRQFDKEEEIASGTGCSMLIKKEVLNNIDWLDESYFVYCEDTDLCWRARLKGYKIYFSPKSIVYHHYMSNTKNKNAMYYYAERNRLTTIFKNYSKRTLILLSPMLALIELLSIGFSIYKRWFFKKIYSYIYNLKNLRLNTIKRIKVQTDRTVSDKEILNLYQKEFSFPETDLRIFKKIINPLLRGYITAIEKFIK